jgi:hypothetical protein
MFARIPNYVLTTAAIVAVIVLVGLYDNQRAPVADGSVGLVVGVPANQLMTQSGDDIVLPVVLRLINRSEKEAALEAENRCKIFMWKQIPLSSRLKPCVWTPADMRPAITNCGSNFGIMRVKPSLLLSQAIKADWQKPPP